MIIEMDLEEKSKGKCRWELKGQKFYERDGLSAREVERRRNTGRDGNAGRDERGSRKPELYR